MRTKNPEIMKRICEYINQYSRDKHHAPTQREMAGAVGLALSSVHRYLTEMEERGMIICDKGKVVYVVQAATNERGEKDEAV